MPRVVVVTGGGKGIGAAVWYPSSEDAAAVNGETLALDGGARLP